MDKRTRNWTIFAGLTILSLIAVAADPCSADEEEAGLCEYNDGLTTLFGCSCCGAIGFAGLALMTKKDENQQVIVTQQQPGTQIVIQQPVFEPQPQNHPQSPSSPRTAEETQSAADLRKQAHLERAHKLEMQGDLDGAIIAYELAEDFKEAQRVRWALGSSKGEEGNGPSNVNISIGKVGDTSVKDSVVTGSDDEI